MKGLGSGLLLTLMNSEQESRAELTPGVSVEPWFASFHATCREIQAGSLSVWRGTDTSDKSPNSSAAIF